MKPAALILTALGVFATTAALAGEPQKNPDTLRLVSYAGLDLKTEDGVAALYRRLHLAAKGVCSEFYTLVLGEPRHDWQTCVRDTLARAVVDVDVPAVTAYAAERIGDPKKRLAVVARK